MTIRSPFGPGPHREDVTDKKATMSRIEARKRELWTDRLRLEAEKTGQSIPDGDELRTLVDQALDGAHGEKKQAQFRETFDAKDTPGFKRMQQRIATQDAIGSLEAIDGARDLGIELDQLDAPRFARAVQQQIDAGVHGRQAICNVAGSTGDGSMLLNSKATPDETSIAMSTNVQVDGRPDSLIETELSPERIERMSADEINAELIRREGSPQEQRHQASLDRATAAATPEAKLLREMDAGPQQDPTNYEDLTAEECDALLMKESGQTDPRSGRYETNVPGVTVSVHD